MEPVRLSGDDRSRHGGVHRADRPVSQLVHASRHVDGGASGKPWGLSDRCFRVRSQTVPSRDTAAESSPVAHSRRSLYGPPYHVGCHASRSMRWRICRRRLQVKWLSASWRMKDRACRMRRPPVLNSRCCRLVSDQLWMARGNTSRRKSMALLHRRRDSRGLGGLLHQARAANVVGTCSNASFNSVEARS